MQLSKLMTQNNNRQGVEDLLAKLQKECSHLEGEASSLQQDLADRQTSCEQLQGALAESRWAAGLHASGVLGTALLVPPALQAAGCGQPRHLQADGTSSAVPSGGAAGREQMGCRSAWVVPARQRVESWVQSCLLHLHLPAATCKQLQGAQQADSTGLLDCRMSASPAASEMLKTCLSQLRSKAACLLQSACTCWKGDVTADGKVWVRPASTCRAGWWWH